MTAEPQYASSDKFPLQSMKKVFIPSEMEQLQWVNQKGQVTVPDHKDTLCSLMLRIFSWWGNEDSLNLLG